MCLLWLAPCAVLHTEVLDIALGSMNTLWGLCKCYKVVMKVLTAKHAWRR